MTAPNATDYIGRTAIDSSGDKLGKIGQVYLDDQSGEAAWVTVSTGLFGTKESFAPLYGATEDGDRVRLGVTKDQVSSAPSIDDDGHISEDEQAALYDHYSAYLSGGGTGGTIGRTEGTVAGTITDATAGTGETAARDAGGTVGRDTSGPTTDDAMTRSEEQLRVGTERVEAGRARLRKYVVTENVTQTVPVSHEEVRIEREPITDANRESALDGPAISEEEHEVTLHAERPVVQKEAVPVERVRLGTETVTGEEQVSEQVRQERIEADGVETAGRTGDSA